MSQGNVRSNICEMSLKEWLGLPESEQKLLRFNAKRSDDLESAEQLKQRITEYIHIMSLQNCPLSLRFINRQFLRVSAKCGASVAQLISELIGEGKVEELEYAKRTAYFSAFSWCERQERKRENGESFDALEFMGLVFQNLDGNVPYVDKAQIERDVADFARQLKDSSRP